MREDGLQGAFLRKRRRTGSTRQNPRATPAPDLVNRDFTAAAPDRLWVADATRIPCGEGRVLAGGGPRRLLQPDRGVALLGPLRHRPDLGALEYAIWTRNVHSGQVVHHSDRGSNYTSLRFGQRLEDHGILASMKGSGRCLRALRRKRALLGRVRVGALAGVAGAGNPCWS
jgi:transposase InsO family protein